MPLRDDLLTPIPGDSPSGVDLRYDPVIDKIKEARREELEAPQGAWKTAVKVADYPLVIKLASDTLASRSKNLQIAVWLVDAHVRKEGFAALAPCFRFLRQLCEKFWDSLYPEIEEDDLEMRAAPLEWLGSKLEEPIRLTSITANGLSWFRYKESRTVGYESAADNAEKRKARERAINEGKITAEEFDAAIDETPKAFYESRFAALEEALAELEELTTLLDQKFGSFSPSFVKTRTALEDNVHLIRTVITKKGGPTAPQPVAAPEAQVPEPAAPPPAQTAAAPVVQTAAAAAPAPPAPEPVVPPPSVPPSRGGQIEPVDSEDAVMRLAAIARYLRAKDAYDISAYLILRGFRWGEMRYNGPDIDRGMLTGPGDELRENLARRFAASDWDGVLALTESTMETSCGRAWLDLQRYTVKALEAKGPYFAYVADAVRTGVRGLIHDLPALLNFSLRDGGPVADETTREWIEKEVLAGSSVTLPAKEPEPVSAPPPPSPEPVPEPPKMQLPPVELMAKPPQLEEEPLSDKTLSDVFDNALRAAQEGRLSEALKLLQLQLASEHSGRERFRRRVQVAHLLVAAGQQRIAKPVLEEVVQEIENRRLEDWEDGEALAYPLQLLLRCVDSDASERSRLYAAVCRLDPARALQIEF